jgi:hypothetical protein
MLEKIAEEAMKAVSGKMVDKFFSRIPPKEMLEALDKLRLELNETSPDHAKVDILTMILWGTPTHPDMARILLSKGNYSTRLIKSYINAAPIIEWDHKEHKIIHTKKPWVRAIEKYAIFPISIIQLMLIAILFMVVYLVNNKAPLGPTGILAFFAICGLYIFWLFFKMLADSSRVFDAESFEKRFKDLKME